MTKEATSYQNKLPELNGKEIPRWQGFKNEEHGYHDGQEKWSQFENVLPTQYISSACLTLITLFPILRG